MNRKSILPFFLICFVGFGLSVSSSNCVDNLAPNDGSTFHDPSVDISGDYYRDSSGDVDIYKCSRFDCGLSGSFEQVASYSVSSGSHSFSETLNNLNPGNSYGFEVRIYDDTCQGEYPTWDGFTVDVHSASIDSVNPTSDTDDDDISLSMDYTAEEATNLIMKIDGNTYTDSGSGGVFSKALTLSTGETYGPDFELRDPDFNSGENLIASSSSFFDILALTSDYSSRSPNGGADVKGDSVDFSFDFESNKDGTVQLYMDGSQINSWSYGNSVEGDAETYSHSETGVSDGTHNWHIEFSASETSETSSSSTRSFEYQDNWPVSVDSVDFSPNNPNRTDQIDISTTVSDYDNNVDSIDYTITKDGTQDATGTIASSDGSYTLTDEYEIPEAESNYELTVTADDGQNTDSMSTSFTVDNHPPSMDSIRPEPFPIELDETIDVYSNVSDVDENIDNVTVSVIEGDTTIVDNKVMSSSATEEDYESTGLFTADEDLDYTITSTVNDIYGESESGSVTLHPNVPPNVNFTISNTNPNINESFDLNDQSSDPDGTVTSFDWFFGNGDTKSGSSVSYNYSEPGDKTIELEIQDDSGSTNSTTKTIHVNYPPSPDFDYVPTHPNPGEEVEFTDQSTDQDGTIESSSFTFPDGRETFDNNPIHTFDDSDDEYVELEVTDDNGYTNSTKKLIDVNSPPNLINFDFHKEHYEYKDEAYLTANVSDSEVGVQSVNFTLWAGENKRISNQNGSIMDNGLYKSPNITADLGLTYFNGTIEYVVDNKGLKTSAQQNISFYVSESPPNIQSSTYVIDRTIDDQRVRFDLENHGKIIETWRGDGSVEEFTNETLELSVNNPISSVYNVTNNESLASNSIDTNLEWGSTELVPNQDYNNRPESQEYSDAIKINNSGTEAFNYIINSDQLNQDNTTSMTTTGRVFAGDTVYDGPSYRGDWIENNKSGISITTNNLFIQDYYYAEKEVNLTETQGIDWSNINLTDYADPGLGCSYRSDDDKTTSLGSNVDKSVNVDYRCDTGNVTEEIVDTNDNGDYLEHSYEATINIPSNKTDEKELNYEISKDKLDNISERDSGSLEGSVNGKSEGLRIEDRISRIRMVVPNDFGNSSLHKGDHTFKLSWTEGDDGTSDDEDDGSGGSGGSGDEIVVINDSASPPEPQFEFVDPENARIDTDIVPGGSRTSQFRIQNVAGKPIEISIEPNRSSVACEMVKLQFGNRKYNQITDQEITGGQTGFGSFVYITYIVEADESIELDDYSCDYLVSSENGYTQTLTFNTKVVEDVGIQARVNNFLNNPIYRPSGSQCLFRGVDNSSVNDSDFEVDDDTMNCEYEVAPPVITVGDAGLAFTIILIPGALVARRLV